MSAWARWVEIDGSGRHATVQIIEWPTQTPADIYRHYRQLDPDKYRPHGDGGLIVTDANATTYITFHAAEPPLGVDLPTPPSWLTELMDGQDPLIGDNT